MSWRERKRASSASANRRGVGKAPEHVAIVQPWQPGYQTDADASYNDDFSAMVAKRPIVQVMHFADHHHLKAGMRRTLFEIQAMSSGDHGVNAQTTLRLR